MSDSRATPQPPSDHSVTDTASATRRSKTRAPIPISETPSTQTFDNTLVELPVVTSSSQRHRDSVTSSSSSANQLERHSLPDSVTSPTSTNQRRRNEMLEYFAVRRPQVKWTRPVRLPPTNSERCLKTSRVYQSRSQVTQPASSTNEVINILSVN